MCGSKIIQQAIRFMHAKNNIKQKILNDKK